MDASRIMPNEGRESPAPQSEALDALALVRRMRDDFAARSAGLSPEELIALVRHDAAVLQTDLRDGGPPRKAA